MIPQDPNSFTPNERTDWIAVDAQWFKSLASAASLTVAEKVHLARLAIQQQWVADIKDTHENRETLETLGLYVAAVDRGFLIASGNPVLGEYVGFRKLQLSVVEAGVLYGYPSSATLAFARIVPLRTPQPWPESCAAYFLGGAYSRDCVASELDYFVHQWEELQRHAPDVCRLAEATFASAQNQRAA